jgi:uncharacterized membrane protein YeiH
MRNARLVLATDLVGVFVAALNGALVACRKRDFDLVGVLSVALATGLGGGLMRDTLLEQGPPLALRIDSYLFVAGVGGLMGFFFGRRIASSALGPRVDAAIKYTDALTLGNFAVSSTILALNANLSASACFLVGIIGASGGGVLRDLLTSERISVFVHGELYATAAGAASATTLVLVLALNQTPVFSAALGWLVGISVRVLALLFKWKGPLPLGEPPRS